MKSQRQYTELCRAFFFFFFPDIGNSYFHILFSFLAGMKGNLMFIALILSNQLRPRLNMHACAFVERERECCRVVVFIEYRAFG